MSLHKNLVRQLIRLILFILYGGYFVLIVPISIWMLFNGQTWIGRGLAVTGLLMFLLPLLIARWLLSHPHKRKIWAQTTALLMISVIGFIAVLIFSAPPGISSPGSPVQHRFFRERSFSRFSLTNIIPESEQVNLGFLLMTFVDPYITVEQASRVRPTTMNLYHEMERDENFQELGSVMGLAYNQLFSLPFDAGHYYLYIPKSVNSGGRSQPEPLPALVFLHGSAGNFKTYTWVWSKFAEQEGFVIIAPSYGFGVWDERGLETAVEAIEDAKQIVAIDDERLYLAGLSNGGVGVSRLADQYSEMFAGLIFLSPVFDTGIVDSSFFHTMWAERPVLVISGEADRRIPLEYVQNRVTKMQNGGIPVTTAYYPGEDHFLTFSQPENIMNDVASWLNEAR